MPFSATLALSRAAGVAQSRQRTTNKRSKGLTFRRSGPTNVYADSDDLALIKEIAARRGVPEAQIIREGIHLAAMSNRVWDGSFDWPTFDGSGDPATSDQVTEAVAQAAARR